LKISWNSHPLWTNGEDKMVEIEIRKFKDLDLKDGTILEGFPGVGLVSAIAAASTR
jgi:proteasome assembly chaperone (PAC2) family protein